MARMATAGITRSAGSKASASQEAPSRSIIDGWTLGSAETVDEEFIGEPPTRRQGADEGSRRIDYVFLRTNVVGDVAPPVRAEGSRVVLTERFPDEAGGESLSDHYGVLTSFAL